MSKRPMSHRAIMAWGAARHYPYLWIGAEANPPNTQECLRHGEQHYRDLRLSSERRRLASLRIARWMELEQRADLAPLSRTRIDAAIACVDAVLEAVTHIQQEREIS